LGGDNNDNEVQLFIKNYIENFSGNFQGKAPENSLGLVILNKEDNKEETWQPSSSTD